MSEPRTEILRMVADKVIDVAEAERLLKALEAGEGSPEPDDAPSGRRERRQRRVRRSRRDHGGWSVHAVAGIGETIGAVVRAAVDEAMLDGTDDDPDDDAFRDEPRALSISAGGRLVIRQDLQAGRTDTERTLILVPAEGDQCRIEPDPDAQVRSRQAGSTTELRWRRGVLKVHVPTTVDVVDAKVLGGTLSATDLPCRLTARIMGGEAEVADIDGDFDVQVMGGALTVSPGDAWAGSGRVRVMGGAATLRVRPDLDATIQASATGGEIEVDPELGAPDAQGPAFVSSSVVIGDGAGDISVSATGGRIAVRRRS